ncbi:MAG TPA: FAD-dependent oxidoreductase [Ilumatobacteraceae bacterium]|nr:FAD-dependent oxidoreductase [Ilumatobacteraceae bacterium]
MTRVVVIGGDAAGMSAAAQASRGTNPPELVVFERGDYTSFAACGLPYLVGGVVADADLLVARSPEQHRANGIDVRTRHEVVAIDLEARDVEVRDLDGERTFRQPFDHLLIATGASPIRPPLPNIDASGVMGIQTIPDALAIDEALRSRSPRRAVVVGGGYIGLEMVEAFQQRGLEVVLIERLAQPMATMDADMGARVAAGLATLGVDLRLDTAVEGFEVDAANWVTGVVTADGVVPADIVVMGLGVRPNTRIAAEAGIPIGPTGAIATDARMATTTQGVWAAGDCAESHHRVSRRPAWVALGTHANKQGRVVGINLSGGHARFPGVIGTAVTKVGGVEIARTGLTEIEAATAGFDAVANTIEGSSRAHYYPGGGAMAVKVVAERRSGRMLGAQIVGGAESAKRIDALAVAVWNEMTVDEFGQLDLGYAPPFSPVWDTTLIAARTTGDRATRAR